MRGKIKIKPIEETKATITEEATETDQKPMVRVDSTPMLPTRRSSVLGTPGDLNVREKNQVDEESSLLNKP